MKIKYLVNRVGKNLIINPGDIEDVIQAKADRLIDGGLAEIASEESEITIIKTVISKPSRTRKKKKRKNKK